jgi:hypothetical protein
MYSSTVQYVPVLILFKYPSYAASTNPSTNIAARGQLEHRKRHLRVLHDVLLVSKGSTRWRGF